MTATAYADIRRRLAEATGPGNQALARDAALLFREDEHAYPRIATLLMRAIVVGSLDAALALVEEKLPGTMYMLRGGGPSDFPAVAELVAGTHEPLAEYEGATICLALLSALFAALEAQHG